MSSDLSDQYIDDTFDGILHMNGNPLPSLAKGQVYDGSGQASSLKLGLSGNGADVSGQLVVDTLKVGTLNYPSTNGSAGEFLYQVDANTVGRTSTILGDLNPDPSGNYDIEDISAIKVNSKGLVTEVSQNTVSSDVTKVTSTYYFKELVTLAGTYTVKSTDDSDPLFVNISSYVPSGAKSIIAYIQPMPPTSYAKKFITSNNSALAYSKWFPVIGVSNVAGGTINGNQFTTLITTTGARGFYVSFSNENSTYVNSALTCKFFILGYQQ